MCPVTRFTLGLMFGFGAALGAALLFVFGDPGLADGIPAWRDWVLQLWWQVSRNLQGSVYLFVLVLLFYVWQLHRLRQLLQISEPRIAAVLRVEQLLDLCSSLFFGIGVIWTAIGMRGALLFALGDAASVPADSGMAVLQRLVEGGILLALSTTIVGGVGGYLMRAAKYLLYGRQLSVLYLRESRRSAAGNLAVLQRIESRLESRDSADRPGVEPS